MVIIYINYSATVTRFIRRTNIFSSFLFLLKEEDELIECSFLCHSRYFVPKGRKLGDGRTGLNGNGKSKRNEFFLRTEF